MTKPTPPDHPTPQDEVLPNSPCQHPMDGGGACGVRRLQHDDTEQGHPFMEHWEPPAAPPAGEPTGYIDKVTIIVERGNKRTTLTTEGKVAQSELRAQVIDPHDLSDILSEPSDLVRQPATHAEISINLPKVLANENGKFYTITTEDI